jgi:hypothetical protein
MPSQDFPDFIPGEKLELRELKRMNEQAQRAADPFRINADGAGLDVDFDGGMSLTGSPNMKITAQITGPASSVSGTLAYPWAQTQTTFPIISGGLGVETISPGGQMSLPGVNTARERNGNDSVPFGSFVDLYLGDDGSTWFFNYPPTPASTPANQQPPPYLTAAVLRTAESINGISTISMGSTTPANAGWQAGVGLAVTQGFNAYGAYEPGILWDLLLAGGDDTVPLYNVGPAVIPPDTEVVAVWTFAGGGDETTTGNSYGWTTAYFGSSSTTALTTTNNVITDTGTSTITVGTGLIYTKGAGGSAGNDTFSLGLVTTNNVTSDSATSTITVGRGIIYVEGLGPSAGNDSISLGLTTTNGGSSDSATSTITFASGLTYTKGTGANAGNDTITATGGSGSTSLTVTDLTNTVTSATTVTMAPLPQSAGGSSDGSYGGLTVSPNGGTGNATTTFSPGGNTTDIQSNQGGKIYGDDSFTYISSAFSATKGVVSLIGGGDSTTLVPKQIVLTDNSQSSTTTTLSGLSGTVLDVTCTGDPDDFTIEHNYTRAHPGPANIDSGDYILLTNYYGYVSGSYALLGDVKVSWNGVSGQCRIDFGTYSGGAGYIVTMNGNKLGFFGTTAVVQPSTTGTTAGYTQNLSANTVFNESTFTGGIGASAYTISDVVLALKQLGVMAM